MSLRGLVSFGGDRAEGLAGRGGVGDPGRAGPRSTRPGGRPAPVHFPPRSIIFQENFLFKILVSIQSPLECFIKLSFEKIILCIISSIMS